MQIYEYPLKEKLNIPDTLLALGFFDGLHTAHRDLLNEAKEIARAEGLSFGVFTFKSDGAIKKDSGRLYNDAEKAEMLEEMGADYLIFADFGAISGASPENFVKKILVGELNCRICVAGFNFRFGRGAAADSATLTRLMEECDGKAVICDEITADGTTLSATLIRGLIADGQIEEANRLLGAPYYIKGRVSHGRADGRKIGFPTANVVIESGRLVPRKGVYRTTSIIDGKIYSGVSNVGVCPTFEGDQVRLEIHLINYDGDLYGKEIKTYLLGFIRPEMKFGSIDELKMQIIVDKNTAIRENGEITWQDLGLK